MSSKRQRNNFYSVAKGRTVGIFTEWSQCEESIYKFHNSVYKGHRTLEDAIRFMAPAGFTCETVIIYDENMIPKKASDFNHRCTDCSTQCELNYHSDNDPDIDEAENCEGLLNSEKIEPMRIDSEEICTLDIEQTIPKKIDVEDHNETEAICALSPSSCIKRCTLPDNAAMLQCSDCRQWIHFICTELPTYMLYSLVRSKRKFTCTNCVTVTDDWLELNRDHISDKTAEPSSCDTQSGETVNCETQTRLKMLTNVGSQATYEQVSCFIQTEQTNCCHDTTESATQTEAEHSKAEPLYNPQHTVYKVQSTQTDSEYYSVSEVKNHINDVVHQIELTLVNSLQNQHLNSGANELEINSLQLDLQTVKAEKQQVKNDLKLVKQQLQEEKEKGSKMEIDIKHLQLDCQKVRDDNKQYKDKCKNLKIQIQAEHEKCNKTEMELSSLKHDYDSIEEENNLNKEKYTSLKQQLQSEKDKNIKKEQQLQNLHNNSLSNKQIDNNLKGTTSKLDSISNAVNDLGSNVHEINTTMTQVLTQMQTQENISVPVKSFSEVIQTRSEQAHNVENVNSPIYPLASTNPFSPLLQQDQLDNVDVQITGFERGSSRMSPSRMSPSIHTKTYKSRENPNNSTIQTLPYRSNESPNNSTSTGRTDKKVLLLGNSHLSPIIENNFIKDHVTEKHICYTIDEGITFLQNSEDSYKCIFIQFITNDVKTKSVVACIQDVEKLIEICENKWPLAKIVISTGPPRGDSESLNAKVHACNVKLQGQYIDHNNVSFCDNASLGIRGDPNRKLFSFDRVHLSGSGIRVFVVNMKISISRALGLHKGSSESIQTSFGRNFSERGMGRGHRPRGRGRGYGSNYRGYRPQSGYGWHS